MSKKDKNEEHWSKQKETGGTGAVKFLFILFKIFPMLFLRLIAFPVGFFYYIFSKRARKESRRFFDNIAPYIDEPKLLKKCKRHFAPLRHIISFALSLLEKIQTWSGKYNLENIYFQDDDIKELINELDSGKGVLLIISHLGNAEALRGMLNHGKTGVSRKVPFTAIMNVKISANFNKMLKEINPESGMDIIGADEVGPDTAVILEERITSGGMVLVAGDRTSAADGSSNMVLPFLGKPAHFSSGMFYIASIMNASVYFVFGLRRNELSLKSHYDMHVHKSGILYAETRKERKEKCIELASSFVSLLEIYCKKQPFQWYNFYNFWQNLSAAEDDNERKTGKRTL